MEEVKHTPGPWKVELNKRAWGWVEVVGPSFAVHGPTQATDLCLHDEVKRIADANLIAAAPDLLEALKAIVADVDNTHDDPCGYAQDAPIIMAARSAIAKAEGRA